MKILVAISLAACLLSSPVLAASHHPVAEAAQAVSDAATSGSTAVQAVSGAVKTTADDATSVINHAVDKASAGLAQITSKLEAGAPEAWRLVVAGTKAKAEAGLVVGLLSLLWAIVMWLTFYNTASKADWCDGNRYIFPCIVSGISGFTGSIFAGVALMNSDTWAAYFSPDGYLAVQILQMALNHT